KALSIPLTAALAMHFRIASGRMGRTSVGCFSLIPGDSHTPLRTHPNRQKSTILVRNKDCNGVARTADHMTHMSFPAGLYRATRFRRESGCSLWSVIRPEESASE